MFLFYLDASGTPHLNDSTKHYALIGAAVHENTWFALNSRIRGLKRLYAFPGEDFELHVMDFNTVIDEQVNIAGFDQMNFADRRSNVERLRVLRLQNATGAKRERLKTEFRRTRPFVHLTRAERSRLYEESLDLIGGHKGLVLFQAFEQVITRFDAYLQRKAAWRRLSTARYIQGDKGLIVMDSDAEKEREIERQFADYRRHGHPWGQLHYVIDAPFFVSSAKFHGVQIVDVCAYAVRRYLDKGATIGSHEEKQFLRIFSLFDRNLGRLHGLRHYTQGGTCACLICRARGHSTMQAPPAPFPPASSSTAQPGPSPTAPGSPDAT